MFYNFGEIMTLMLKGEISFESTVRCMTIKNENVPYSTYKVGALGEWYGLYDSYGNLARFDLEEINSKWKILT